jgi:hypothetical protein
MLSLQYHEKLVQHVHAAAVCCHDLQSGRSNQGPAPKTIMFQDGGVTFALAAKKPTF